MSVAVGPCRLTRTPTHTGEARIIGEAQQVRLVLGAFIGGIVVLGVVVAILSLTLRTNVSQTVGVLGGVGMGVGAAVVAFAWRRFLGQAQHGDAELRAERSPAVVVGATGQGIAVLFVVVLLLNLFLAEAP